MCIHRQILELSVFQKINEYRVESGLHNLKWDDATYKSTQIHTYYMIKDGKLSHTENSETPMFTDRIRVFLDNDFIVGNENVNAVSTNNTDNSIDEISDLILYSWKRSKSHNDTLLGGGSTVGVVSCGDNTEEMDGFNLIMKY